MKRIVNILSVAALFAFSSCIKEVIPEVSIPGGSVCINAEAAESAVTIRVTSNVELDIETSESWLQYAGGGSFSTGSYKFHVTANHSLASRSAVATFKAKDHPEVKASVTVLQAGEEANVMVFGFKGKYLSSPELGGSKNLQATIDWGDNNAEAYSKGLSHTYGKSDSYTVTLRMLDNTNVKFEDLEGIESMDFSQF